MTFSQFTRPQHMRTDPPSRYAPEQFPKLCRVCETHHTEAEWVKLPGGESCGDKRVPLEQRHCPCGNTMVVRTHNPGKGADDDD